MTTCIRCYISGRVQGVFFRASTQSVAIKLGIKGYARNLPDRRVEVLACGEEDSLRELQEWLSIGPEYAQVEGVECAHVPIDQMPQSFSTS